MKEYELGKEGRRGMNEGGRKMDKVGREMEYATSTE